ncbi:MAG: peptidase [Planctomycetota bacterium]|nr:MAG: peptidase [Planctomycetota bacterium]
MSRSALCLLALLAATACAENPPAGGGPPANEAQRQAADFLARYNAEYQRLQAAWNEAEWAALTRIVEGDDSRVQAAQAARRAYTDFTGAAANIDTASRLLAQDSERLQPLQIRQLERVLYWAAANPETAKDLVAQLIAKEGPHIQKLYAFEFQVNGQPMTPNEIDEKLRTSTDLAERKAVWEASKEVGPPLKDGLAELRDLRNGVVQPLGYRNFWAYQVSDYGMTVAEMQAMLDRIQRELRPLYRELHTWARYELARRYGQPVPDLIPAHWLPNRWAQDWSALVQVEGANLDAALENKSAEWLVRQGEDFYVSMGFEQLPASFWSKSSLYPVPKDAGYKKNTHASAWHIDLDHDVRSLMSVEPNAEWYETVHHELGHVYYYLSYARPAVPVLCRDGANRAFHEGVGSLMGMAAMQQPFLERRGVLPRGTHVDAMQLLLREALSQVVFIPFSAGTMSGFERALYAENLSKDRFNSRWWELAAHYQGVNPPERRGEQYADGLSKTHIHDDAGQYYDYALSYIILMQLHDHIAREILHQDPHATNYYGRRDVGEFLRSILEPGGTVHWQDVLRQATGSDISAEPMLRYFEPLMAWLKEQNRGRTYTLPEI